MRLWQFTEKKQFVNLYSKVLEGALSKQLVGNVLFTKHFFQCHAARQSTVNIELSLLAESHGRILICGPLLINSSLFIVRIAK